MLSRKYYKMIAQVIKDNTIEDDIQIMDDYCNSYTTNCIDKDSLINDISIEFKKDNSLFNINTFKDACND